jgi:uncharacterized protein (TIGR02679 family)
LADPLVSLMQSPQCRPLLERLCRKLQSGETLSGSCRLSGLTNEQRQKISELTGTQSRGKSLTVNLGSFGEIVRNTGRFGSLRELIELAAGHSIENKRAERDAHSAEWNAFWTEANRLVEDWSAVHPLNLRSFNDKLRRPIHDVIFSADRMKECLSQLRRGWLKRATRQDVSLAPSLLNRTLEVLSLLPTDPVPLAIFSAEKTGDAHALDNNQSLGRLVLKFINACQTTAATEMKRARLTRQLWESVGIVPDELSSSVLVLNLPAIGNSLSDRTLREHAATGMPCRLTFRHLRLHPATFTSPATNDFTKTLYVCENPSVVAAAADRLGPGCPPLVCLEGHPSLACWRLLKELVAAGYEINYHGDFDWGGIRIANKLYDEFQFVPWRFTTADHTIVVPNRSTHRQAKHRALQPPESAAIWDRELANSIRACGVCIEEESVIESLLDDLANTRQN